MLNASSVSDFIFSNDLAQNPDLPFTPDEPLSAAWKISGVVKKLGNQHEVKSGFGTL